MPLWEGRWTKTLRALRVQGATEAIIALGGAEESAFRGEHRGGSREGSENRTWALKGVIRSFLEEEKEKGHQRPQHSWAEDLAGECKVHQRMWKDGQMWLDEDAVGTAPH